MKFWLFYARYLPVALWDFLTTAPLRKCYKIFSSTHVMAWNDAVMFYEISQAQSQMELDAVMWQYRKWLKEQKERLRK